MTRIEEILELARWAPSGDNTQPWRFELRSPTHVAVHAFDTRQHCVYDLDGRASQLSVGALLETIRIAASRHGLRARVERRSTCSEERPVFDVRFEADPSLPADPLADSVRARSVQRRPLQRRALRAEEKAGLQASLPQGYELFWLEGARRASMARLLYRSAKIRLTIREAYEVHRAVIEWGKQFSEDRIPDQAVGLDPVGTRLMAWAMQDWRRIRVLNMFFAGTVLPRLQLDFLPALACGAHILVLGRGEPRTIDDYVAAGAAVQRLWLTATALGLQHQPELTPLIFARYARAGVRFSENGTALSMANAVQRGLAQLVGEPTLTHAVWMGRIGAGPPAQARSLRLPLVRLMKT